MPFYIWTSRAFLVCVKNIEVVHVLLVDHLSTLPGFLRLVLISECVVQELWKIHFAILDIAEKTALVF